MEQEIWRDITGYEGIYQISDLGRVRSFKSGKAKILKPGIAKGYYQVNLSVNNIKKTIRIHKLVAVEFLSHQPDGHKLVIDHVNGIKTDNRLENLRIVTNRENISLGYDKKTTSSQFRGVTWCKLMDKWIAGIRINGKKKHIGYFKNELDAANAYSRALNEIN